jgi:hypothetical protein|nr:MAG TPA: hypothetical protein [Caudoviricetes sp.]
MNELIMIRAFVVNRMAYYQQDQADKTFNSRIISELNAIHAMVDSVLEADVETDNHVLNLLADIAAAYKPNLADEIERKLNED